MSPLELWLLLGLCTGYYPDPEMTMKGCEKTFEAKMRHIPSPSNDEGFGKFGAALSRSEMLAIYRSPEPYRVTYQHTALGCAFVPPTVAEKPDPFLLIALR